MIVLFSRKKAGIDEDHHDDSGKNQVDNMIGFIQGIQQKLEIRNIEIRNKLEI